MTERSHAVRAAMIGARTAALRRGATATEAHAAALAAAADLGAEAENVRRPCCASTYPRHAAWCALDPAPSPDRWQRRYAVRVDGANVTGTNPYPTTTDVDRVVGEIRDHAQQLADDTGAAIDWQVSSSPIPEDDRPPCQWSTHTGTARPSGWSRLTRD